MGLDIRIPLGLMFLITGAIMAIFGLATQGSAIYAKSLGVNLNLGWGALMFLFGLIMFVLGRRSGRIARTSVQPTARPLSEPRGH